jgi:hypothetical protein
VLNAYVLKAGGNLENCKFTGDHIARSCIAGDSHVKCKNVWKLLLNSRIAVVAI